MKRYFSRESRLALLLLTSIAWNVYGQTTEQRSLRSWIFGLFVEEVRHCSVPNLRGEEKKHCEIRVGIYRRQFHFLPSDPNPTPTPFAR